MSERFYINWPLGMGPLELDGPEAHHLATVCRLRAGDLVTLFNGDGREYQARITRAARRAVALDVLAVSQPEREHPFVLEIAAPLPKGDRAQFLIEKLTELGVTRYVPLLCNRGVIHPGAGKMDKLVRYVVEASKQCGRNVLMEVAEPVPWAAYSQSGGTGEMRWLAHPGGESVLGHGGGFEQTAGGATGGQDRNPVLRRHGVVGPEGGFTDEEVALGMGDGWRLVDLGPRVLRIETAALVLAARLSLYQLWDEDTLSPL